MTTLALLVIAAGLIGNYIDKRRIRKEFKEHVESQVHKSQVNSVIDYRG